MDHGFRFRFFLNFLLRCNTTTTRAERNEDWSNWFRSFLNSLLLSLDGYEPRSIE